MELFWRKKISTCIFLIFIVRRLTFVKSHPQTVLGNSQIRFDDNFNLYKNHPNLNHWASESSHIISSVYPNALLENQLESKHSAILENIASKYNLGDGSTGTMIAKSRFLPIISLNESASNIDLSSLDRKSRFFSLDTSAQSLNLGVSFTVPFVSIPTKTLMDFGSTTGSMLSELVSMNLPSIATAVIIIGAVMLIMPKIMNVLLSFLGQYGIPGNFKFGQGIRLEDNDDSTYENYMRSLDVAPFTSILNQIEDAMREYNLDSTSCMQRVVCSYISEADDAVGKGKAGPFHFIIKGITGTSWLRDMLGNNALTEALEVGSMKGASCSQKFPKCPFSIPGVVKLLASYLTKR